jgi:hypothetical protein
VVSPPGSALIALNFNHGRSACTFASSTRGDGDFTGGGDDRYYLNKWLRGVF